MNRLAFEAVNRHLKDICHNENAFGGKLVVHGGDFKHILPMVIHGSRESIVAATIHRASCWNDCHVMHLRINMRLRTADQSSATIKRMKAFKRWIMQVGEGEVQEISTLENGEPNLIKIPHEFLIQNDDDGMQNLIATVYPNLDTEYIDWLYLGNDKSLHQQMMMLIK